MSEKNLKNKPKYFTTNEATEALWEIIHKLNIKMVKVDFGYERNWDEKGNWLFDGLTAYYLNVKNPRIYITTMSPEKFEAMNKKAQADFLNYLIKRG